MYGGLFGAASSPPPSTGYDNPDPANVAYRLRVALDRDDRLTAEEAAAKHDVEMEIEFGPRWWLRAHP